MKPYFLVYVLFTLFFAIIMFMVAAMPSHAAPESDRDAFFVCSDAVFDDINKGNYPSWMNQDFSAMTIYFANEIRQCEILHLHRRDFFNPKPGMKEYIRKKAGEGA